MTRILSRVQPSRAIRISAWATVAFAIFQFLSLPFMSVEAWATLSVTIVLAFLAFRRVALGLVALGVFGVWRLGVVLLMLLGTPSTDPLIVAAGSLIPVTCAVLWIWGAVTTIRCIS